MRTLVLIIFCAFSISIFSQEKSNEFLEVIVEGREAFMSTKNGEVVFMEHATTDASAFITDANGTTFYIDTKIHIVQKGETLSSIAKKHKTSIDKLKSDNKKASSKLAIGQKLKINTTQSVESLKPTKSAAEGRIVARLRPGENPAQLNMPPPTDTPSNKPVRVEKSQKVIEEKTISETETEVEKEVVSEKDEEVKGKNNTTQKDSITIESGDSKENTTKIYTVKKGDTLYAIAKKHNMTVQELKKLNDLILNNLSIGQKLKVE